MTFDKWKDYILAIAATLILSLGSAYFLIFRNIIPSETIYLLDNRVTTIERILSTHSLNIKTIPEIKSDLDELRVKIAIMDARMQETQSK